MIEKNKKEELSEKNKVSDLTPFNFNGHVLSTVSIDSEPYFIGKDVCEILEYKSSKDAIRVHCKGAIKHRILTNGGHQEVFIIPERDLYRLVMRSKLPEAEKFEEWVVGEVLPQIRKTGSYNKPAFDPSSLSRLDILRMAIESEEKVIELTKANEILYVENSLQKLELESQAPIVKHASRILDSQSLMPTTLVAQKLCISAIKLNRFLQEQDIIRKVDGTWVLRQKYIETGFAKTVSFEYTKSDGDKGTKDLLKWTEKGRQFVMDLYEEKQKAKKEMK